MRRAIFAAFVVATFMLVDGGPCALGDDDKEARKAKDEEVVASLKEFRDEMKNASAPQDEIDAIQKLAGTRHPEVLKEIAKWISKDVEEIREGVSVAAVQEVGMYQGDKDAAQALIGALKTPRLRKPVVIEIIKALGDVGYEPSLKDIHNLFSQKHDVEINVEAVKTAGMIGSPLSIKPLIDLLREIEAMEVKVKEYVDQKRRTDAGFQFLPRMNHQATPTPEEIEMNKLGARLVLKGTVNTVLRNMTGENLDTSEKWGQWQKKYGEKKKPEK